MNQCSYASLENEPKEDVDDLLNNQNLVMGIEEGKNSAIECPSHSPPITMSSNAMAALKRDTSPVPQAVSLPDDQECMPLSAAEEMEAVEAAESCCDSHSSQDPEKHFGSAVNLVEDSLKLCMQSQEEGESSGHCSSDTLPCVEPSACLSTE